MDNDEALSLIRDRHAKYADVESGGESMTMIVRITGGLNAAVHSPMIFFQTNRAHTLFSAPQTMFMGFAIAPLQRTGWTLQRE